MNIKTIHRILWNTKPKHRCVSQQLELQFPQPCLSSEASQMVRHLQKLRADLERN